MLRIKVVIDWQNFQELRYYSYMYVYINVPFFIQYKTIFKIITDITQYIILTVIIAVMPPKWPNRGEATMSECKRTSSLKDRKNDNNNNNVSSQLVEACNT